MKELIKDSRLSVGAHLKRERELRDIELDEVARVTRVQRAYLEAIERGSFADLPADVYVRGYIRAYARFLAIDAEACIERYVRQSGTPTPGPAIRLAGETDQVATPDKPLPALAAEKPEPATSAMGTPSQPPRRLGLALAIVLLFIAAMTISIIYYVNQPGDANADDRNPTTTENATFDVTG